MENKQNLVKTGVEKLGNRTSKTGAIIIDGVKVMECSYMSIGGN